jgi:hypothetical protein
MNTAAILAARAADLPKGAAVPGHVVLLGDSTGTPTRIEALAVALDSTVKVDAAMLATFALALSENDPDGHSWHVCANYRVPDVVATVAQIRMQLRAATRASAPSRDVH